MLPELAATVAAIIMERRSKPVSKVKKQDEIEDRLRAGIATHADLHKSIDLRATVLLIGFLTVLSGSYKDGQGLFPDLLMKLIATVGVAGIVASAVCLYATIAGLFDGASLKRRTEIVQKISRRKLWSTNISLWLMVVDAGLYGVGMWF